LLINAERLDVVKEDAFGSGGGRFGSGMPLGFGFDIFFEVIE